MFDRKVLKNRAKYVLTRTLFVSVVACVIVNLVAGGGSGVFGSRMSNVNIQGMSSVRLTATFFVVCLLALVAIGVSIFIAAPLKVGLKHFMLRCADFDGRVENLTYPFKNNYKNILWVTFVKNLYVTLWSILGIIPVVVSFVYFDMGEKIYELVELSRMGNGEAATMELSSMFTLLLIAISIFMIPAYIKSLQYSMVEYILAENPNGKALEIIGRSKEMMVGNKWASVKLEFSFLGWVVLASFVCCGLGTLILNPYIEATYAQMYLEISGQGKDYGTFDYQNNYQNPFGGFGNM